MQQGALADSARTLDEARKLDEEIAALTREIGRVQAALKSN